MKRIMYLAIFLIGIFFINVFAVDAAVTCKYDLTNVDWTLLSGNKLSSTKGTNNAEKDTYVTFSINETYDENKPNISLSTNNTYYLLDKNEQFNVIKGSTGPTDAPGELLYYYQSCPDIMFIFAEGTYKSQGNEEPTLWIKNIIYTTNGSTPSSEDIDSLLSVYNGSVPSDLELKIGTAKKYDPNNKPDPKPIDPQPDPDPDPDDPEEPKKDEPKYKKSFDFCSNKNILQGLSVIHTLLSIARILVPLIIIILATIDLSKAVISGDDKAIQTSTKMIINRLIIGVIIFFIPTIVYSIIHFVDKTKSSDSTFSNCDICLTGHDKDGNRVSCDY